MKKMNVLPVLAACMLFAAIGCTNNEKEEKEKENLEGFLAGSGSYNVSIPATLARQYKHNFDMWHRNRKYYNADGSTVANFPKPDAGDDNDVPLDQGLRDVNDSLTKAVWFSRKVITFLAKALKDSSCDGVRVYFASYDTLRTCASQHHEHQSTIYLVPTDSVQWMGCYKHKDNFNVIPSYVDGLWAKYYSTAPPFTHSKDSLSWIWTDENALNHGELCPSECSPQ